HLAQRGGPYAVGGRAQRGADPEVDHAGRVLAEQEPGAGRRLLRSEEDETLVSYQRLTLVDHENAGPGVLPGRVDPVLVRAPAGDPVDCAAGQRQVVQGHVGSEPAVASSSQRYAETSAPRSSSDRSILSLGAWGRSESRPIAMKTSGAARISARSASGPLPPSLVNSTSR